MIIFGKTKAMISKFQYLLVFSLLLILGSCQSNSSEGEKASNPRFQQSTFENSQFIDSKGYEVYLPPSYQTDTTKRYPVLYMMDRQNLFADSLAYGGHGWRMDQVLDSLVQADALQELILVGVDHAGKDRFVEYMPQKPVETLPGSLRKNLRKNMAGYVNNPFYADNFLKFLTKELKPHMDSVYRTLPDTENTFMAGSSMGGLISIYALCEYPDMFAGAMCLSTHWPVTLDNSIPEAPAALISYFAEHLPSDKKWYFDYGTRGIDQFYEPYQQQIDSILLAQGYQADVNWMTRKYEGHDHNEKYWYQRVAIPLEFVIGKE